MSGDGVPGQAGPGSGTPGQAGPGPGTPDPARLGPGSVIGGYRLERRIGRGGMAVVYSARDEHLDRRVALKVLSAGLTADHAFRRRFIRESRAAAAVDHPNIIPVYDAGESAGHLFIAMRYVRGGDVRSLLREAGPLPGVQAWSIVSQVASALDAAHVHGLVHRDVKPANMLLDSAIVPAGQQPAHVYLTDFGISKHIQAEQLTAAGQIVGTLGYVAPEQIEGHRLDGRADQYSLACSAFEILSGTPPFLRGHGPALIYAQLSQPPPSLIARRPELPLAVDRVLARALAKTSAERYRTCSEFASELGRALRLLPGQAGPAAPPGGPARNVGAEPPTKRRDQ